MIDIFLNLPLFLGLLVYTLIIILKYKPNIVVSCSLMIGSCLPFLLNDFLFPSSYFSDQSRYLQCAIDVRETFSCIDVMERGLELNTLPSGLEFSAYIFAFFPAPIITSILSLSLINRFLFTILMHYLLQSKRDYKIIATIISVMPSIIFYSAVALRDNLIFVCFIFFLIFIFERRILVSFIPITFMLFLKPVIGLSMLGILLFISTAPYNKKYWKTYSIVWLSAVFILFNYLLMSYSEIFFDIFNRYSRAMAADTGVNPREPIFSLLSLYQMLPSSIYGFFYSPSPGNISSVFLLLAFIENNLFIILFLYLLVNSENKSNPILITILLMLIVLGAVFAVIVFNDGSLTRYIYPIKAGILACIILSNTNLNRNLFKSPKV
jgi:hypothetical protein